MFLFPQVAVSVLDGLALGSEGVHLLLLLLDEKSLSSHDLLHAHLDVLLLLFSVELDDLGLHLVGLVVFFLPG